MNITPKKIEVTPILNITPKPEFDQIIPIQINTNIPWSEEIVESLEPKSVNSDLTIENVLENCETIPNIEKLKEKLIKLGIRFNTDPKLYQKRDYWLLICILYRSLLHLYESDPESVIVTDWEEEPKDTRIPSEKLVKKSIDSIPAWAKLETKPSYTAQEVGALPDNTIIPDKTSQLINDSGFLTQHLDISGKLDKIPVIDKTSDSSSSFVIDPNKMYMFGTRTTLTITFNPGDSTVVNEYMFLFTSGSVATTLNVTGVVWMKELDIQPNKKYLVSIENNLGLIGEWNNE